MRYHVGVYDITGEVSGHEVATREEACDLAAILRRRYRNKTVVIHDMERDGATIDEDEEPGRLPPRSPLTSRSRCSRRRPSAPGASATGRSAASRPSPRRSPWRYGCSATAPPRRS